MYDVYQCLNEIADRIRELEEETEELVPKAENDKDRALIAGRYAVTRKMRELVRGIQRGEGIQ